MAGCLAYAELGINLPRSGGEYIYLREAWGPTWGFMSGWVSFFAGFSAPIAASALAASVYLGYFVPFLSSTDATGSQRASNTVLDLGLVEVHWGAGQLVAISLVAVFALVNVFGLRIAARLQNVLTTLKVGVILVFITLGVFVGKGNVGHFLQSAERTSSHTLAAQFGVSLIVVMFAYSGWNAATYVVEELRDPATVLPRVLVSGTLLVLILYLCLNMIYIYAVPLEELKGVEAVGAVTATALFGKQVGDLFSAVMAMALVSAVSAMVIAGPRVYYAMAIDGCFFPDAGRIHPRWQSPARSILYQALAASMMILVGSIEALFYYVGFALIFFCRTCNGRSAETAETRGLAPDPGPQLVLPCHSADFCSGISLDAGLYAGAATSRVNLGAVYNRKRWYCLSFLVVARAQAECGRIENLPLFGDLIIAPPPIELPYNHPFRLSQHPTHSDCGQNYEDARNAPEAIFETTESP